MSETLINPNQILDGTSSKIKILNIVQTGTLTRNGAVYSGFSSSNYLQLGDSLNNGYLSYTTIKDFGSAVETADSWEMVWKIKYKENNLKETIFYNYVDWGCILLIDETSKKLYLQLSNNTSGASIGYCEGTTILTDNEIYYFKIEFTGTAYNLYLSTDGVNWNLEGTISSPTKITNRGNGWFIGTNPWDTTWNLLGFLDISESYIKINGEYWWKGVEII